MRELEKSESFKGFSIVSCGVMKPELSFLRETGFLDADRILYTTPGLHEIPRDLEDQLSRKISKAKEYDEKIIVVYGSRCYLDFKNPLHTIDKIMEESGKNISRVAAANCVDMLADSEERNNIAGEEKIYWLTPGWFLFWKVIFKDWDTGRANETFPQHVKAIILDPINFFEKLSREEPAKILEFSDWMKIPIESHPVSLKRLKLMLIQAKNTI